jgi:hypothetical protein
MVVIIVVVISNICLVNMLKQPPHEKSQENLNLGHF